MKTIRTIISIILTLCCIFSFTACGNNPKEKTAVAIVIGARRNVPAATSLSESTEDLIYDACYTYGDVTIVTVEGSPRIAGDFDIDEPELRLSSSRRKQLAEDNAQIIINELSNVQAKTEQADVFEAIKLAADSLKSSDAKRKVVIISDSGITTTGLLDMSKNNVLDAEPEYVIERLSVNHALPDLKDTEVIFSGLGAVSGEQEEIPDNYSHKLENLWSCILEESGATTVTFDKTPVQGEENPELPYVTPVDFPEIVIFDEEIETIEEEVIKLTSLKFVANKAEFINKDEAVKTLKPIAKILVNNPDCKIYVAGTTASAGDGTVLSKQRAEATKEILVELGADKNQIKTLGLGCTENQFHVNDLDANGNLIEEEAAKNRAIYIFSQTSKTAEEFK